MRCSRHGWNFDVGAVERTSPTHDRYPHFPFCSAPPLPPPYIYSLTLVLCYLTSLIAYAEGHLLLCESNSGPDR